MSVGVGQLSLVGCSLHYLDVLSQLLHRTMAQNIPSVSQVLQIGDLFLFIIDYCGFSKGTSHRASSVITLM